jgi:predicted DNA repair protein MutK
MLGGAYLCYEGFEKLAHKFLHSSAEDESRHQASRHALVDPVVDLVAFERDKIKGAIRTDFILSAEIIVIALGTVQNAVFMTQVAVVAGIALVMTLGVYGFVAGIVKLDDAGLHLLNTAGENGPGRVQAALGRGLLGAAPYLMKTLAVVGTAAMFLVGGGILLHGLPQAHGMLEHAASAVASLPGGGVWAALTPLLLNALAGVLAGALVLAGGKLATGLWNRLRKAVA